MTTTTTDLALGDAVTFRRGDSLQRVTWREGQRQTKAWLRDRDRYPDVAVLHEADDQPVTGFLVGRRTLANGVNEWLGYDGEIVFSATEHLDVALIATGLRRRFIRVRYTDVSPADDQCGEQG